MPYGSYVNKVRKHVPLLRHRTEFGLVHQGQRSLLEVQGDEEEREGGEEK